MVSCDECKYKELNLYSCAGAVNSSDCTDFMPKAPEESQPVESDAVNAPQHYIGKIECIDYLRDKLTPAEFTGFCIGNVLKYCSRWRKKDGVQDLHKAMVYLKWAIENEEKNT